MFNKTHFTACFYLQHQKACFIQTLCRGDQQSRAAWASRGEGRPQPTHGLPIGGSSGEASGQSSDRVWAVVFHGRSRRPRVWGSGRDWSPASTQM